VSGKKPIDTSNVKAAPDAEEFKEFGSNETLEKILSEKNEESVFNKDVEAVQVAGLGKAVVGAIVVDATVKAASYGDKIKNMLGKNKRTDKTPKLTPKKVPCFNKNKKGTSKEYDRQLKDQQNGLNDLTAEEYLEGRKAFSSVKRKSTKEVRIEFKKKLIDDYKNDGMSKAKATQVATEKMKTLHALHNPDLIAGGTDKVTTFGDKSVNQSIGSQWKKRVDDLDKAAEKAKKEGKGTSKMNAVLTRCK